MISLTIRSLITLMALASASYSQGIPRSGFEWNGGSIGDKAFDRAALMVPVRLEHKPDVYWMQLDTGCNVTIVYRIPFDQLKYPAQRIEDRDDIIALSGTIGNCPFDSFPVFVREDFTDSLDGALEDLVSRASMLPITTTKEIWRRLTGLQGIEESAIRIKVPYRSPGEPVRHSQESIGGHCICEPY